MSTGAKKILLLPQLHIHNANALSSPFTIGFPAMTAWLGAGHALERKLNAAGHGVRFVATGVACHEMDLQTWRGANDFVASVIATANPLDKTGARSPFIEEPRCHLNVSLLLEVEGLAYTETEDFKETVGQLLNSQMRIAGGDIQHFETPEVLVIDNTPTELKKLVRKLMPSYVLISRCEIMQEAMRQGKDAMDVLLDYLTIHHRCEEDLQTSTDQTPGISWKSRRLSPDGSFGGKPAGWLVPIATGFHGISEPGTAKNQRDPDKPHLFAESVVTLGEFKMPYHFNCIDDMLWQYHTDLTQGLYLCRPVTDQPPSLDTQDDEFS